VTGPEAKDAERFAVPFVKAVVLSPDRERFLLQRRDKRGDPYVGFWELPGGRMRHGETVEAALARELAEETGLVLARVLGQPERGVTDRFGRAARGVVPLAVVEVTAGPWPYLGLYFAVEADGVPRTTAEAAAHRWITMDEFRAKFLEVGEESACATLDLAALRQVLARATLGGDDQRSLADRLLPFVVHPPEEDA
jgi:ADP-ribose pyrophosphatase YjhB (NUDIX family)